MSSARPYPFKQVDVFTRTAFRGNPVAVVFDADGLDDATMQTVATWTNLSETTFVQRPSSAGADYRLRIFTPNAELPFAGHPSVGSAHAIVEAGLLPEDKCEYRQECGAGILDVRVDGDGPGRRIFVTSPPVSVAEIGASTSEAAAATLNPAGAIPEAPILFDVGPRWLIVRLDSADDVHALVPDFAMLERISRDASFTGITVFGLTHDADMPVYARSFAPAEGISEDPVCGSGNISVAAYILQQGLIEQVGVNYVANQGIERGRDGRVSMRINPETGAIAVGGSSVTCIDGELSL